MDLILWRHAEAEDGTPDAKRALTPRGEKQARKIAKWLAKRLPEDVRIVVSPALRCQQTAEALGLPFHTSKLVGTTASESQLLKAAGWPDAGGTALVVGHQPTLGRVAALLLTGEAGDWTIRKGAVWWFRTNAADGQAETVLHAAVGPDLV
jgi:phosphohistidine phosphatase